MNTVVQSRPKLWTQWYKAIQNYEHRRQWRQGWRPTIGSWTSWRPASASPGRPRSAGRSPVGSRYEKTVVDCRIVVRQAVADPWYFGVDPDLDPRIHASDKWIRIRGGSGSCYFRHWPTRCQQKQICSKKFFCLLLFEGTFTSFFKDKKSLKNSQAVGVKIFLTIFAWW